MGANDRMTYVGSMCMTLGDCVPRSDGRLVHLLSLAVSINVADIPAPDSEEMMWVERAKAGDVAGFNWLLARYRTRTVRLAAHILRRPSEAEDAAQEAFVLAFKSLRSFRGTGRFYTWLYTIVVRVCLEKKRSARWGAETAVEGDVSQASKDSSIEERLLVESLLDQLNPPMRATLVLRELEGLDYEEIAQVLRIPVGTVRSRLNAARAQFRTLWAEANEEASHV